MRLLRRSTPLAFGLLALGAAPALALKAGSRTVVNGDVRATVSWSRSGISFLGDNPKITITQAGRRLVDHRRLTPICQFCTSIASPRKALHVRDLDGDGRPEVFVDLFSGGAHCCSSTIVFVPKDGTYRARLAFWGNDSYDLADYNGDGVKELVTGDDRFSGEFTSYAGSARPPLIFDLVGQKLEDVTRMFPSAAQQSMADIDRSLARQRKQDDGRGLVAARAADMALLGQGWDRISAYLDVAAKKGWTSGDTTWPSGARFRSALKTFLRKTGYIA